MAEGQFKTIVDNAGIVISTNPKEILVSSVLGSNLCAAVFDPDKKVGGMVQCMLPRSHTSPGAAIQKPAMFVDTGIKKLLEEVCALGASKKKLIIKAAGCADIIDTGKTFQVGKRNYMILKKFLWKEGMIVHNEATGGTVPRSLILEMKTGKTFLLYKNKEVEL